MKDDSNLNGFELYGNGELKYALSIAGYTEEEVYVLNAIVSEAVTAVIVKRIIPTTVVARHCVRSISTSTKTINTLTLARYIAPKIPAELVKGGRSYSANAVLTGMLNNPAITLTVSNDQIYMRWVGL